MKFFIGAGLFWAGLLALLIVSIPAQQTGLSALAISGLCVVGNPMLAIAVYRIFSGVAGITVKIERNNQQRNGVRNIKSSEALVKQ